ncbi:MAG: glutamate-1-semialdehyde 2,1-aminomutase [Spirochaetales bacterium]|nr:glutamate-1-semialdehyde 2,1-aminomutase [Spirochaetales bacterium]
MNQSKSQEEFARAVQVIPGGVNSPVRAFNSVGGNPLYLASGKGAYVTDIDGNRYIDYLGSWGPLILGHSHPAVVKAVQRVCETGMSYGAPTVGETDLAEKILERVPSLDKIRFVNSGTEATMSAVRLARGFTKRDLIIKFDGCYHGHGDSFLIAAGSGAATLGVPNSPGVTTGTAADTLIAPYNDLAAVEALFKAHSGKIAAVIVEPVAGNMGVVPPGEGFLSGLRRLTEQEGALLILDEVMTGFRVARGGAQELYGIRPDLSTFGKVIGGGMPVGAYGGKGEIMDQVAPLGPVYQAGTLSGNPLATAAGKAAMDEIDGHPHFYEDLEKRSDQLAEGMGENCKSLKIPYVLNRVGSMMTLFFTDLGGIENFAHASRIDTKRYGAYFHHALEGGIYLAPSPYEAAFVSSAHGEREIEQTLKAHYEALKKLS